MASTGFQSNAFQSSGFQVIPSDVAPSAVIGGHYVDMTGYRRQIESMIKAAEKRDAKRYRNQVKKLIKIAEDAGIEQPKSVITEQSTQKKQVDLDFTLIISELNRLLLEIERVTEKQKQALAQQRDEEELIFLLALS